MKRIRNNIWKITLWITGMILLVLLAFIWYWVISFDLNEEITNNTDSNRTVEFSGYEINESTDSWETTLRLSDAPEDEVVYTGATISGNITNANSFNIKDWTLRIDIDQECFLNAFWCGSVEVHQFRDEGELINEVVNQQIDIKELNIDQNAYSDTMMIHLMPGDYLIYLPSESAHETIVEKDNPIGIGFIFYFQGNIDISHWSLTYNNDLKMMDLIWVKLVLIAGAVWIGALILYLCLESMKKRLKDQMNDNIKSMSIMADLFIETYLINVDDNSGQLIKGDENHLLWNLAGDKVQQKINNRINNNLPDIIRDELMEFMDLSTATERMQNSSIINYEYNDPDIGWCVLRLFNTNDDGRRNRVVLTVQDINEEKKQLSTIESQISFARYKQNISGSFMGTVAGAFYGISNSIIGGANKIMAVSDSEEVSGLAEQIIMNTRHLNLIQNTFIDLYAVEGNCIELKNEPYSVHEMVDEIKKILQPYAQGKPFELIFDVDDRIPDMLVGDRDRIEQILVILLFSSMMMTQNGFVKFSLFGKQHGNEEEMIFSMRDTAAGFTEKQLVEIQEFISGSYVESIDNASLVYLRIINGILAKMNSELKVVSVLHEGTDFYFTIIQKLAD